MPPAVRLRRRRTALAACAPIAFAAVLAGCGERPAARDDAPSPPEAAAPSAAVQPDTSRDGAAFVAVYPSGPYDELRVVRATDGALVVGGATRFPDGTRIAVTLLRTGARGPEAAALSRATVELGRFMSGPLAPTGGAVPPGVHTIRLTVPFGPDDQSAEVLQATDSGRRFEGPGAQVGADGRLVHEILLEVPL
jgi:hypothetical protein